MNHKIFFVLFFSFLLLGCSTIAETSRQLHNSSAGMILYQNMSCGNVSPDSIPVYHGTCLAGGVLG